jgi:ATP-dependent DNA helicase RecQ
LNQQTLQTPEQILQHQFGYSKFRHSQKEIIDHVMSGKDSFVLMPTGGGKSLCYQIPALAMAGVTIVVSPLIALMKDQVDALRVGGISAAFLNSTQSADEQRYIANELRNGGLKMLYVAPERMFSNEGRFLEYLKECNVSLFAIDEAHCISQWGHDFRPEYRQLAQLKEHFPKTPIIALTATADAQTRDDILDKLNLNRPRTFVSSFNRANIYYYIERKKNYYERLVEYLRQHENDCGIIYCLSRAGTEELAEKLRKDGFLAKPYNAGLDQATRQKHQEEFLRDDIRIIVATVAFGMGINKSNVRFVVHVDLPKNIEGYYQETGRAGRDGLPSEAILFYSAGDVMKLRKFAEVDGNPEQTKIMIGKLNKMQSLCEIRTCRRKFLLNYFGETAPNQCGSCDVCLSDYEKTDATIEAQKVLSAVYRLQENYGSQYVVDFLKGSQSEKIKSEHKELKTYGVGADLPRERWLDYIKDMVQLGFLKQSEGQYPVLQLTDASRKVLKGEEKVWLVQAATRKEEAKHEPKEAISYEKPLFERLKNVRKTLADKENVAGYQILSDATLIEMAAYLPQTEPSLRRISGIGDVKLALYGSHFLNEILHYCQENRLSSRIENKSQKRERKPSEEKINDTKQASFQLFRQGHSVTEIGQMRNLQTSTIESHLAYFIMTGEMEVTEVVPKHKIPAIEKAIAQVGDLTLSPIKEVLGNEYSYGEIRAVLGWRKRKGLE